MPRTGQRGGPQTRARIASVAAALFLQHGFDDVTVAQIARAAGVSSVTVFNHFPRKEDLFLDRSVDAEALLRAAVRDRASGVGVLESLCAMALRLADDRHPLSGLHERALPFFATVAGSPALIARAREIGADLEATLAEELFGDPTFRGDPTLLAAFFVAGYARVLVETGRRRLDGEALAAVAEGHHARLQAFFEALRHGVADRT